jgi:hypothetical protein
VRQPLVLLLGAFCVAVLLLAATPTAAYGWTPGTHIFLGEAVMRSLPLLPQAVAELIAAFPYDFLYGNIAADTSMAKKYAAAGRHCHSWNVGLEIYGDARAERMRAFGLGYLAHLAADVVAHNYFVPHQLTVTSTTTALGHSYWESRFDTHIGERYSRRAREVILRDHSASDEHLDRILSPTIFSTPTNRRIFHLVSEKSRWDLREQDVSAYMMRSYDYIIDLFNHFEAAEPYSLDPAGTRALRAAKRVRRATLRRGGDEMEIAREATTHFGLPSSELTYAGKLEEPLYPPPARDTSS